MSREPRLVNYGCMMMVGLAVFLAGVTLWFVTAGGGALRYLYTQGADRAGLDVAGVFLGIGLLGLAFTFVCMVLAIVSAYRAEHSGKREYVRDVVVVAK